MRSQRVRHDWATEQRPANQVDGTFDFHLNPVWYYALTHSCGFSSTGSQLLLALFILPMDALLSISSVQFSSFAACQASLSINNSRSLLKVMSIESVMPSNHLILCCLLLFLPSIFPSIRVFSNESDLRIRWPKYWSFSFSINPSTEYSGLISFRMDLLDLLPARETLKSLLQHHSSKAWVLQHSAFFMVHL